MAEQRVGGSGTSSAPKAKAPPAVAKAEPKRETRAKTTAPTSGRARPPGWDGADRFERKAPATTTTKPKPAAAAAVPRADAAPANAAPAARPTNGAAAPNAAPAARPTAAAASPNAAPAATPTTAAAVAGAVGAAAGAVGAGPAGGAAAAAAAGAAGAAGAAATAVNPPPPDPRLELARRLIDIRGTADARDRDLIATELARFPQHILERLQTQNTRVIAVRNGVTEVREDLRGVRPRGWPPGSSWDTVPGLFDRERNQVIIATRGHGREGGPFIPRAGDGHGSYNLVLHETGHALDRGDGRGARQSESAAFQAARERDLRNLPAYERQEGAAGPEETYAESIARFYGGDPNAARNYPALDAYWRTDPLRPRR